MALAAAMLPAVLGATGCFDAHSVDQGPWVIDDFEDGDLNPADRNFGSWGCYTWPQGRMSTSPFSIPETKALSRWRSISPSSVPQTEAPSSAGAGVATVAAKPEDFSRFSEMVFTSKLVPGVPALPTMTNFTVHLGCSTVPLEETGTNPWQSLCPPTVLRNDRLAAGPARRWPCSGCSVFTTTHIQGGPAACLRRVDSIHFEVEPRLPGRSIGGGSVGHRRDQFSMRSQASGPCVALFAIAVALVASSCSDAHEVDPGVLVIDDFDEGAFPVDATFLPWQCFLFNANGQPSSLRLRHRYIRRQQVLVAPRLQSGRPDE